MLDCWQEAERTGAALSLLLIHADIDSYRDISDLCEDYALRTIAQAVQQAATRPQDLVVRYGTFTFAVLLPEVNSKSSLAIARLILRRIAELSPLSNRREQQLNETSSHRQLEKNARWMENTRSISPSISVVSVDFSSRTLAYTGLCEMLLASEQALQKAKFLVCERKIIIADTADNEG